MTADEPTDVDEVEQAVRIAKGKQIYDLIHRAGADPKDLYEMKGRIFALNSVLHFLEHGREHDYDEGHQERLETLAETDAALFEERIEQTDDEPEPTDLDQEVY